MVVSWFSRPPTLSGYGVQENSPGPQGYLVDVFTGLGLVLDYLCIVAKMHYSFLYVANLV